jgi:UDP-glucuronate 4-epimerase
MKKISSGEPVPMFGDGTTARDYTYIEDIVEGIYAALQHPQKFDIINLGNSHPINLKGMIQEIEKALGKNAVINQQPMQKGDVERTFANISKAKDLLNWEPKTSFAQGIEKMAQWYNETYA